MITHLAAMLHVRYVGQSIDWYQAIGFKVITVNQEDDAPPDWALLDIDGQQIMITAGGTGLDSLTLYLTTDDVSALYEEYKGHADLEGPPCLASHGMEELVFIDPDGARIVFAERTQDRPDSIKDV